MKPHRLTNGQGGMVWNVPLRETWKHAMGPKVHPQDAPHTYRARTLTPSIWEC